MKPTRATSYRRTRSRGASQDWLGWLGCDAHMASVVATAQRYAHIRQALAKQLPAGLAGVIRVIKLDEGQLTLAAPSAAHVAKLRQLAPRLLAILTQQGWHVNAINIRIHAPVREDSGAMRPARAVTPLDAQALQAFAALHNRLPGGPLADAVARLLRHHGTS